MASEWGVGTMGISVYRNRVIVAGMPKNVFEQDGKLYFNKQFRRTRFCAPLGLDDTPKNRVLAEEIASNVAAAMKAGFFDPNNYPFLHRYHDRPVENSVPTFAEYAEQWLEEKSVLSHNTVRTYRDMINKHLIPELGGMPVTDINRAVVEIYHAWHSTKFIGSGPEGNGWGGRIRTSEMPVPKTGALDHLATPHGIS